MDFPKSVPNAGLVNGQFVDENVGTGQPGSLIPAAWGNSVTKEILSVLAAAEIQPDELKQDQLAAAILKIVGVGVKDVLRAGVTNTAPGTIFESKLTGSLGGTGWDSKTAFTVSNGTISTASAVMTFLRGTSFGFHFGIDTDNKLKRGGISLGTSSYEIWDELSLPLATKQQAEAGVDLKSVMTPARVAQAITKQVPSASETAVGIAAIATQEVADGGVNDSTIITPKKLKARLTAWFAQATETILGAVRIATQTQAINGVEDSVAVTPLKLKSVFGARGLWDSSVNVADLGSGSAVATGLYGSNGATNSPAYAQLNTLSMVWGQNTNIVSQLALGTNSNRLFMRSFNKTTNPAAPWVEFFSTGNVSFVGAVVGFMTPNAPLGWLKANGAAVSRTTYSDLFALIGTGFGSGDGSTTFNVPDLRAEFLRGYDDGRGQDPGRTLGNAQAASVESHTHTILNMASSFSFSAAGGGNAPGGQSTAATQAYGGTETRPRNVNVLFCIKY